MRHLHIQTLKSAIKATIAIITAAGLSVLPCRGQDDSVKNFKNTIRFNITNPILFSAKFNVIGYERVIKDYQTASINIGRSSFGTLFFNSDSLETIDQRSDKGFNLSLDYRFYLQKENKYRAPRGVYIGPYYAYNFFSRDITWGLNTDTYDGAVVTGMDINAHFIGAQLGYQFVFWNRLSVDMILMGPGWWHFNVKTSFDTTLSPEDEAMLLEQLNTLLEEKFPGSDFVISGEGLEATKNSSTSSMGFRYMINIGFRF
jgi:hypothetical protein